MKLTQRLVVMVALLASMAGVALAPSPAVAGGTSGVNPLLVFCWTYWDKDGTPHKYCWVAFPVITAPQYPNQEHTVQLDTDLPVDGDALVRNTADGIGFTGEAAMTTDPARKARYQAAATAAFDRAVATLGTATPQVVADSTRQPWLTASGEDVVDGLLLLKRAQADPANAASYRAAAQAQFDEACYEASHQVVIAG
ncbi:hypothetical protein [Longispora urticae]